MSYQAIDFNYEYLVSSDDYVNKTWNSLAYFNSKIESAPLSQGGVIYSGLMPSAGSGLTVNYTAGVCRGQDLSVTQLPTQGDDPVWPYSIPAWAQVPAGSLTLPNNSTNYIIVQINATYDSTKHSWLLAPTVTAVASLPTSPATTNPRTYVVLGLATTVNGSVYLVDVRYVGNLPSVVIRSFDYSNLNIGANTLIPTGVWLPFQGAAARLFAGSGWIYVNKRNFTIGSPASGASYANNDAFKLYDQSWYDFSNTICPVSGGRGVDSWSDWNANKTLGVFAIPGAALGCTDAGGSGSTRPLGLMGADEVSLTAENNGPHIHESINSEQTIFGYGNNAYSEGGGGNMFGSAGPLFFTSETGSGTPFSIIDTTYFAPFIIKL